MKKNQKEYKPKEVEALEQINLDAAGIDIGAEENYVAIPAGRDEKRVRVFGTYTADLTATADWLADCGVKTVAMESTGVYWVPLYELLESRGFEVCLVNARHLKNVPGRQTDVSACQWLQQLHTYGLLAASFRPPEHICAVRALVRQREMLIRYRAAHIQHMQKALTQMNIQLTQVISDITGVTGLKIIRAIVAGQHNPAELAQYRQSQCAKSEADIAKALEGNYRREHLFVLKQALKMYDFYGQQLEECDQELAAMYQEFEPARPATEPPNPKSGKRRKNQPFFDLAQELFRVTGVDLTQIDGLDALSVQTILSEVGTDLSPWPTVKHFASWLRLAPNNRITGGKVKGSSTGKTDNPATTAFRVAAQSLARSDSELGAFYRHIKVKHGAPKAVTATAHKLARIFYFMLKRREPYRDRGADYFQQQHKEKAIRNLKRRAAKLGLQLLPLEAT
jgi:transposase